MSSSLSLIFARGQSIWVDNLSRAMVSAGANGEPSALQALIAAGVRGLTSNPTIFKNSIADTADYHGAIRSLAAKGESAEEIITTLMCEDVGAAARALLPVYEQSESRDGFASIEVSPLLADSTEATIQEAVRLWERIGLPNVMIKIPATEAGLPAITEVLARGINVNVTLIFSPHRYEAVFRAFRKGLLARARGSYALSSGVSLNSIASVASFFVSRLDALIEKRVQNIGRFAPLVGHVAVANCRVAYGLFESLSAETESQDLLAKGAVMQRPLWASTGVKNPAYSPIYYVGRLVADKTVNTVPSATLDALLGVANEDNIFIDHLLECSLEKAQGIMARVQEPSSSDGVRLSNEELFSELEDQGVKSFVESYSALVGAARTVIS